MDVNAISQLIGSLGFPIVACGAMFWLNQKQDQAHAEAIDELRQTVEGNTKATEALTTLIKVYMLHTDPSDSFKDSSAA